MASPKILALILAGGAGSRMNLLTEVRAKPALPFGGTYRLIDFPLSNCVHSAIADVWVIEQFQPQSLNDHLLNGRPWDLDRTYGGLRIMPPYQGTAEAGWHRGNADALYRNSRFIREFAPDLVLVLSADHVYKFDYRHVIEAHMERHAEVTMVTTEVERHEASRFGVVEVGTDGKVINFQYKPESPRSSTVTTEIFVYSAHTLLNTLAELANNGNDTDDESPLKDFGHELLPRLVERGQAYAYPLDGYWRDVGTLSSYWQAHMDMLADQPSLRLDERDWPIRTSDTRRQPARIHVTAVIDNSLISPGCDIKGTVIRSVIGPGVTIAEGAVVEDAIVFHDVVVETDACVKLAIVDSDTTIDRGAIVGQSRGSGKQQMSDESITVIGKATRVAPGTTVAAGQRVRAVDVESIT